MKCLHCKKEFEQRFGREKCCSRKCAAFVREAQRREYKKKKLTVNSFLTGAF
jgi:hypothetical protein